MTKNTPSPNVAECSWIELIAETWNGLRRENETPSTKEFSQALAARLSLDAGVASGLLSGCQTLLAYAQAERAPDSTALEEERASVQAALAAVRPVLEARLQHRVNEVDEQNDEVKCCGCGKLSVSQGRRARSWRSTVGPIKIKRRYSWCEACQMGRTLAQERVGLPDGDYTAGLDEVATLMAVTVPHGMAVKLLEQMMGIEVSEQGVKSAVTRRGEQVVELLTTEAEEIKRFENDWGKHPPYITAQAPDKTIEVAYLEVDGVLVMTRTPTETSSEPKPGRGGPGRQYEVSGREVKNAVLYEATACAKESESRGCLLEKTYISHLGEWMGLALLIWAQVLKLGFHRAKLLVVLSDGAKWIRSLCKWLPVKVFLILDLYHVKHKVWEMGATLFGEGKPETRQWAETQCQRIEDGQAQDVIQALGFLKQNHHKAREQIEDLQTYLHNNLDRMDYPTYRAQGLRVGSGAIESTNYHVTGARLKLPGMRWSEDGATQMASLRADLFNGVWRTRSQQILKAA
jgi:Uncharacterised protein family (UPF0236)